MDPKLIELQNLLQTVGQAQPLFGSLIGQDFTKRNVQEALLSLLLELTAQLVFTPDPKACLAAELNDEIEEILTPAPLVELMKLIDRVIFIFIP